MEINYEKKYLKYKQKYQLLKNEQMGGVLIPGFYFIFYSNSATYCGVQQFKKDEQFMDMNKLSLILGPLTYSLQNNSSDLAQVSIEGVFYKNIIKNFNITKHFLDLKYNILESNRVNIDEDTIKIIFNNLIINVDQPISITSKNFSNKLTDDEINKFYIDNNDKIKNILKKLNNNLKGITTHIIDTVIILKVGITRNDYISSKQYLDIMTDKEKQDYINSFKPPKEKVEIEYKDTSTSIAEYTKKHPIVSGLLSGVAFPIAFVGMIVFGIFSFPYYSKQSGKYDQKRKLGCYYDNPNNPYTGTVIY